MKLATFLVSLLLLIGTGSNTLAHDKKVLRYAFPVAETGFDPAQISDLYSHTITANIFESLYRYDYAARPAKIVPNIATAMPEIGDHFRTFTIRIQKGIYFADDPAFGGKKRELTAHDYVYSIKRIFDPQTKSPTYTDLEEMKFIGMAALRQAAEKAGAKFDYEKDIDGIRALDRYTIQFKLQNTRPRFLALLADPGATGALAREVVERYGDKIMEHPVGTGAFMLKADEWVRSSKIVLVKNPNFREEIVEGKRLPLIDRVEISIIEENQPRWLSFLQGDHDLLERLPNAFAAQAIPNNQLAPHLAKKGIRMERSASPDVTVTYFNMESPIVGGYTPDKVALRRAIALAYNTEEEIRLPRRKQGIAAQTPIQPMTYGYDANLRTEMSAYSPARSMALLDMFGYTDKNGDGWRDMPDGKPLVLEYATSPDAAARELNELWKKYMDAIGIRMEFKHGKWPEHLKAARAGKLMMWGLGFSANNSDGEGGLGIAYGPAKGEGNLARFQHAEFDKLYQQQQDMPDGAERLAIMQKMVKILVAYMPYKTSTHRIVTDMVQPTLIGYRRHPFARDFWKYVDVR